MQVDAVWEMWMATVLIGYCDTVGEWHECHNIRTFYSTFETLVVCLNCQKNKQFATMSDCENIQSSLYQQSSI